MSFELKDVVPWGRSFDEYRDMFALDGADLGGRILDCGAGPSSFAATLAARGGSVASCDPIYRFSAHEIRQRIEEARREVIEQARKNAHEFVWERFASVDELGRARMDAMEAFLRDYGAGLAAGRYVDAALPALPFESGAFTLALCSHLLFLYSGQLTLDFHLASIRELCRVAPEVRIFPLMELGSRRSRHLDAVLEALGAKGYAASVERVPYEFQRGGNEMLRVKNPVQ